MVFLIQLFIFRKGLSTALSGMNEKVPIDILIFPELIPVEKPASVFFNTPSVPILSFSSLTPPTQTLTHTFSVSPPAHHPIPLCQLVGT